MPEGLIQIRTVWYHWRSRRADARGGEPCVAEAGGNNSVVECDLAKVEVAGSNPVSRSNLRRRPFSIGAVAKW